MRHGSEKRPMMYLASMDIKTAFDVARPTTGDQDVHGWITSVVLREMVGMEGPKKFQDSGIHIFQSSR